MRVFFRLNLLQQFSIVEKRLLYKGLKVYHSVVFLQQKSEYVSD